MPLPDDPDHDADSSSSATGSPTTDNFNLETARADFLDFFQQEYEGVITFLVKAGARRQDAEDAVQDAFVEAWEIASTPGKWEMIYRPHGWIRKVAIRKYQRPPGPRRRVSTFPVPDITAHEVAHQNIDRSELTVQAEFVRGILRGLEPATRNVMAFHIDGFSPMEIAIQLDMKVQKVYDLTKKGRKALSEELKALGEYNRSMK